MDEVKTTRAKVRERERAVWNRVEAIGREARAADPAMARAAEAVGDDPAAKRPKVTQSP